MLKKAKLISALARAKRARDEMQVSLKKGDAARGWAAVREMWSAFKALIDAADGYLLAERYGPAPGGRGHGWDRLAV